jgi:hypothetical protein
MAEYLISQASESKDYVVTSASITSSKTRYFRKSEDLKEILACMVSPFSAGWKVYFAMRSCEVRRHDLRSTDSSQKANSQIWASFLRIETIEASISILEIDPHFIPMKASLLRFSFDMTDESVLQDSIRWHDRKEQKREAAKYDKGVLL